MSFAPILRRGTYAVSFVQQAILFKGNNTMATRRSARLSSLAGAAPPLNPASSPASVARSRKRKGDSETKSSSDKQPSTPRKRRSKAPTTASPPSTPSTSVPGAVAAKESGIPYSTGELTPARKPRSAAVDRLADPNLTNAQLLSPESSRIVSSRPIDSLSPSKLASSRSTAAATTTTATTATLLEQACAHLVKTDPRMKPLVEAHHCRTFSPEGLAEKVDPFERLASGIISQQVSGAAAKAIKARFVALFAAPNPTGGGADGSGLSSDSGDVADAFYNDTGAPTRFPHPSQVVKAPAEQLRAAGLSQRKVEYITGLAEKFVSGELSAQMLVDAPYEEIVEKLTAVRGLGRWSVEMFACFGLKRMDVFSLGDLGVQRGMAAFVGRDVAKLKAKGGGKWKYMSEQDMVELSDKFSPYRSLFMWYMWRVEETDISTLEG